MDMQIGRSRIGEESLDGSFEIAAFNHFPATHHRFRVEGTHRQSAGAKLFGHLADRVESLLALADINRKTHAVG